MCIQSAPRTLNIMTPLLHALRVYAPRTPAGDQQQAVCVACHPHLRAAASNGTHVNACQCGARANTYHCTALTHVPAEMCSVRPLSVCITYRHRSGLTLYVSAVLETAPLQSKNSVRIRHTIRGIT